MSPKFLFEKMEEYLRDNDAFGDSNETELISEVFEGFNQDISKVTTFKELPTACQKFLLRIQDLTGVKISLVSVGAERNQYIILHEI